MFNLEKTIQNLKDGIEICKKAKDELYAKKFIYSYPFDLIYRFEASLNLLERLKEEDLTEALEKEYRIDKLVFYFIEIDGKLEFSVSYDDDLNAEIYNSYSGSWSTQYEELNKAFMEIADIASFPLNNKSFDNLSSSNLDFLVKNVKTAIKMLNNPTEKFKWLIRHHIELIEKRIAWYNEEEETYFF